MSEGLEKYRSTELLERIKNLAIRFWFLALILAVAWSALIVLAPAAQAYGASELSGSLYGFFSYICHQLPDRSFHVGEHKFGVCSRCTGVYFGLVAGLLIYPLFRKFNETRPFPRIWLILAMVPMAIDFSLTYFGYWENTHFTRVTTGLILGIACSLFIVPALAEIAELLLMKQRRRENV